MSIKKAILLLFIGFSLVGCTSYRNVPYLQNPEIVNDFEAGLPMYDAKIMPKDLLVITVNATDPLAAAPFNLTVQSSINSSITATSQPALQQYLVDNNGEIVVTVRMVNYKISVLGEVARPGTFTVSNEKINVLEALAMAGDMTIYGVRDDVKLIRENSEGKREIIKLNLTNAAIVTSPYYYLEQNDILYVKPNKIKAKNSEIGNTTSLWLNTTSILVSIASLLATILL